MNKRQNNGNVLQQVNFSICSFTSSNQPIKKIFSGKKPVLIRNKKRYKLFNLVQYFTFGILLEYGGNLFDFDFDRRFLETEWTKAAKSFRINLSYTELLFHHISLKSRDALRIPILVRVQSTCTKKCSIKTKTF